MDQYTVGIMAYELLSGHPPFEGDLNTLIMSRLQGTPPPLAHQSQAVNAILGKILDRDPARRFPTLREAFSALKSQV
jgi:serine/threonine-protein kinase